MLRQKGYDPPFYIVGSCSWEEHANRDVKGKRFDAAFKKEAGVDCDAISALSSAEESGDFLIDLAPDGRILVLYIFSIILLPGWERIRRTTRSRWHSVPRT
jgi:hypothetical protein